MEEIEILHTSMEEIEMAPMNVEQLEPQPPRTESANTRKRWHKPLVIGSVLTIVVLFIIFWAISWERYSSSQNSALQEKDITAAYYRKTLDANSQPCEDFYAFACSNLRKEYRKENRDRFDTMAMMSKSARIFLDDLFTKPLTTSDSATLKETKMFHKMCIDKTKAETEGIEPVLTWLNEIGGWPLLANDPENDESWEQIVGSINRAGFETFFPYHLLLHPDLINPSASVMLLTPLLSYKPLRLLPNNKRTMDYVKHVASLLKATNNQIDDDIRNCIDFESKLQELTNSADYVGDAQTLSSLIMNYSEIAWKTFFRNAFVSTGIVVSMKEFVFFTHSKYQIKVSRLLSKTSVKVIRNYVVWRLIVEAIPLMPEEFREAKNAFEQRTVGQTRNLDCLEILISKASVSVGYLYIKHYFDGLSQKKSHGMIKSIERQAYRFLKNLEWMDNNTNTKIIQTLEKSKIDLPHSNMKTDLMEALDFRSNATIFANYRHLAGAHRILERSRARIPRKDDRQTIPLLYAVNAGLHFSGYYGAIYMLAAIFQPPVFFVDQPMYLNYGGIGFIIAHMMTHSMLFTACENKACPSFDQFQERKECMEKLYGGYVFKQLNETTSGKRTAGENINDLISLKLSYYAYDEFAKDSEEKLLPELNYTARQWFWINVATFLCSFESDTALRDTIANDRHSPSEARVNVAFANTDEFSRDFECPIGSRMNPVCKCKF